MPTDDNIVAAAHRILGEQDGAIYLSRLGQDLRAEFGPAFKLALGSRPLGDFVCEHLGDTYEVWGRGPYKRVGPHGSAADDVAPKPRLKYLEAVWYAFSAPLGDGLKRWIDLGPPLSYVDAQEAPKDSAIELSTDFIIGDSPARGERAGVIAASIQRWAEAHNILLSSLGDSEPQKATVRVSRSSGSPESLDALRRMIATIPEDERSRYSLPLNLLGRLLQVP